MNAWTDLLWLSDRFFLNCWLLDWVIALVRLEVRLGKISLELAWVVDHC